MGLFSSIGHIIHGVTHTLHGIVHAITHPIDAISSLVGGNVGNIFSSIGGNIGSAIDAIGSTIRDVVSPVYDVLRDVTNGVSEIQHGIIDRLVLPIVNAYKTYKQVATEIESVIKLDAAGFVTTADAIVKGLASNAALYNHAVLRNIAANKELVDEHLKPALWGAGKTSLDSIHETIKAYVHPNMDTIGEPETIHLDEPMDFAPQVEEWNKILKKAMSGDSWIDYFIRKLWMILMVGPALDKHAEPNIAWLEQQVLLKNPYKLLGPSDAVEAGWRGLISKDQFLEELGKQGFSPERSEVLYDAAAKLLSAGDAIKAFFRGIIDEETLFDELHKERIPKSVGKVLVDLFRYLPSQYEAAEWYRRRLIDKDAYNYIAKANGLDEQQAEITLKAGYGPVDSARYARLYGRLMAVDEGYLSGSMGQGAPKLVAELAEQAGKTKMQADLDWLGQWQDMQPYDWVTAWFRGATDERTVRMAFDAHNMPREIHDAYIEVQRSLIPFWMLPNMLASGAFTDYEATEYLKRLGFADKDIPLIKKYANIKSLGKVAGTVDTWKQLSLSNLREMYNDGIIDDAGYTEGLIKHGYTAETAKLLVQLIRTEREIAERRSTAEGIVAEVNAGVLDKGAAIDKMYSLGYSNGEVAKYINRMKAKAQEKAKLPSVASMNKMYLKGILGEKEWRNAMRAYGYSDYWVDKLLGLLDSEG